MRAHLARSRIVGRLVLKNVNGVLYFTANDGQHGLEPWRSDGTDAGTQLWTDINPGEPSSLAQRFTVAGQTLFFTATNGWTGLEPWAFPLYKSQSELRLSHNRVPDGSPAGSVVGTLTTVEPVAGGRSSYTLVAGAGDADNGVFTCDGAVAIGRSSEAPHAR